jgi:hypothetical protein
VHWFDKNINFMRGTIDEESIHLSPSRRRIIIKLSPVTISN